MTILDTISQYVKDIEQVWLTGKAREHAYRPALNQLMNGFGDIDAINEPPRSEFGNPDFVFLKKSNKTIILGYAEAKDITIDLDKTEKTEQLNRYSGYENLILTNYLEFRFFRNGEKYRTIKIGEIKDYKLNFDIRQFEILQLEIKAFLELSPEHIRSGKRLAEIMGGKAYRIRNNVEDYLKNRNSVENDELERVYKMMKEFLVHDLSIEKFADMYAQTLVYGLFIARYNDITPESFSRKEARDLVPASNPFLRDFFDHIVGPHFLKRIEYIVDELCEIFSVSDIKQIVHKHLKIINDQSEEKDPIIHFYEDFLDAYDPLERKKMGAYYTPLPVVHFIIREVDQALKRSFNLAKGLADISKKAYVFKDTKPVIKVDFHRVQILDPATGTATFLNEIIRFLYKGFKGQEGRWPTYVQTELVPRLYGFELMMAPYTIAHLKLAMTLQETGVNDLDTRLKVYLTNTLEEGINSQLDIFNNIGLAETISHEASEASRVKTERPIMIIVGNPPYSGESSNKTQYANSLVNKYKYEPGGIQKLQERNSKWINDDYVKFIAFAEDMIAKNGEGIVAMITNHGYLDNPTFRGMRWHLSQTFDEIRVLDLHGNTKKKETAPDGSKDENVFNIQQGVAILIAIKNKKKNQLAKVYHSEIFGKRVLKFDQLNRNTVNWKEIKLDSKMFYYTNQSIRGKDEYEKGIKLNDLFIVSGVGITSAHDAFVIDPKKEVLINKFNEFINSNPETEDLYQKFNVKRKIGWDILNGWKNLKSYKIESYIKPITYRPFDYRYIMYEDKLVWRTVKKVMSNFLEGDNVGLMVCRQQKTNGFQHALIHEDIVESSYVSNKTSEIGSTFPLYIYDDTGNQIPNFNQRILDEFNKNLTDSYSSEDILDYIYAILYSPQYREEYKQFLRLDFPRIPVPKDDSQFKNLIKHGNQLRALHLMQSPLLEHLNTTFPISGTNEIERIYYEDKKVWINNKQYFGNVSEVSWNFYIGGYQPAQKWLKDRKGQILTNGDLEHYQKIIKILDETDKIMHTIDSDL